MLELLSKYHADWIRIASSFLGNKEDAEDLVQDMYLRMYDYGVNKDRLTFGDSVNKYFVYVAIRNMALTLLQSRERQKKGLSTYTPTPEEKDQKQEAFEVLLDKVHEEMETWDFYEKTLFEIYMYSGLSFAKLSKGTDLDARMISKDKSINLNALKNGTNISVRSMHNTVKKCKERLKLALGEDIEDYINNDFDKI